MKLRYSATSPYVRKVVVLALEAGLDGRIERIPTAAAPTKPSPEISADNPLGKVPSLTTDDGQHLFDSPVICEYLDSLHEGARIFPTPGPMRWTALRQQALADGILDAALLIRYELSRPQDKQWADWSAGQQRKIVQALDALEAEAARLGDAVTIGTITIGCTLGYLDFRFAADDWRRGRPTLAAWYEKFAARPSMASTMPKDPT
ncbi:glutathione S-transferase [Stella humosa]|uniref:Glutathione S-transferase n=1 Tax=Stella humosa TaxID=94 RepID=A0A3N1LKT2_9PROT|nr:glutathione S-transferase N-terminal domain-containing protein [Stella humosa]ROP91349.1 glutathione S-transferase [Stella humosa]